MKLLILCVTLLVAISSQTCDAQIPCSLCNGSPVVGVDGLECVAVIKEKCTGMRNRATTSWTRGVRVVDNCSTIPSGTAIATFFGPGQTYNSGSYKHAAIFIGCEAGGIRVHDQWVEKGHCSARVLRSGESSSNGADNMWTIV